MQIARYGRKGNADEEILTLTPPERNGLLGFVLLRPTCCSSFAGAFFALFFGHYLGGAFATDPPTHSCKFRTFLRCTVLHRCFATQAGNATRVLLKRNHFFTGHN